MSGLATAVDIGQIAAPIVRALDLAGVAANVLLAGALARSQRFDPVGFIVLGVAAGLGGGMLRDTLVQAGTPVALTDLAYLTIALGAAFIAYLVRTEGRWWDRSVRLLDAVALGTWGAVGAHRALDAGLHWLPAVMLGTITAVGGGMIRDVLLRRTPIVFGGNTLYATCATVAASVVVVSRALVHDPAWFGVITLGAAIVGAILCLISYRRGWRLPEARDWRPVRGPRR